MEGGGGENISPPVKPSKFSVYQNPTFSAALTANSLRPSKSTFLCIFSVSTASAIALLSIISREEGLINNLRLKYGSSSTTAYVLTKAAEVMVGLVFLGTLSALIRAFSLWRTKNIAKFCAIPSAKGGPNEQIHLTARQLGLLGVKPKPVERAESDSAKKPPKSRAYCPPSPSDVLVPVHQSVSSPSRRIGVQRPNTSSGTKMGSFFNPSKSPGSPSSLYLVPSASPQRQSVQTSPGVDRVLSTPWSKQRPSAAKVIMTEEMLEQFLADVDERITESAMKLATPPATLNGLNIASPSTVANSANTSGTMRSTPLRPVRMSPGSQKFSTPPKKGEGDLPQPMSMEESIAAFEHLGVYPQIEQWRDRLRQWFSSVLLNPLLNKIETSHVQVMQAAAKLGISITVNQVGSDLLSSEAPTVSSVDGAKEWQPAFTLDEEGLLHQLRATLVQSLDAYGSKFPSSNLQQSPQQSLVPVIQNCVDAITEHQRLHQLMKGEWVKGLLPQSSVRADYTVQRIRELSEGTCLKNYEYLRSGEVYDKVNKKWTLELPTDSHLLLYLFCAYLEHPKWMLHVDPTSYASAQSSKNPLFLGVLPPKERFPEKYVAVISSVPAVFHPGACILFVGKQSPPLFALYWDKKLQFSLQGRTALWDAILLLCHRIKVDYGGIVRGMHLGSSAYSILPVLDSETED
ncbi:Cytochrome B561-related [Macleaya cordata]|uniref:Cytochrome B561-related n=1 Tax=Macleaya cordata TaxID=56857 RepID=A0A200R604_MACCD|nr:Cytochrome B561-related [Macleaya cordata]